MPRCQRSLRTGKLERTTESAKECCDKLNSGLQQADKLCGTLRQELLRAGLVEEVEYPDQRLPANCAGPHGC